MEDLKCLVCLHEYDDSLVLGCSHSLCLLCAGKLLKRDEKYYENKYIKCDICQKLTSIEEQTLKEIYNYIPSSEQVMNSSIEIERMSNLNNLNNMSMSHKSNRDTLNQSNINPSVNLKSNRLGHKLNYSHNYTNENYNNNRSNNQTIENHTINYLKGPPTFQATPSTTPLYQGNLLNFENITNTLSSNRLVNINPAKVICTQHSEEVQYFCFSCFGKCICSECVIHGDHKNHEVLNARQAYPIIIDKTNELMNDVSDKIIDIKTVQSSIEKSKLEIAGFTEKIKQEMAVAFSEVRKRIDNKEKELLDKADKYLEDTVQEFNTYSRIIQAKVIALNKMIDSVNSNLLRKDEVHFINFFAENKKKLENLVNEEFQNFPDLSSFKTIRVNVNLDSLNNMIHTLGGLHLEISMLKGFDFTKKIKAHKSSNDIFNLNKGIGFPDGNSNNLNYNPVMTRDYSKSRLNTGTSGGYIN